MGWQKNDIVTVTIEDMGHDGAGIGKIEGYTLFIKDAVIGDMVSAKIMKTKKNYGYARLLEVIKPSKFRVEPQCSFARQCGGCQIQELDYQKQLEYKEAKIRGNLKRIGGFTDIKMEPIVGMENPFNYRNKAQFPIGTDKDGNIITGFYAGRTHDIVNNRRCFLGVEVNEQILDIIISHMEENSALAYDEQMGVGLMRHVLLRYGFATKEIMVCLVINGSSIPNEQDLLNALKKIDGMTSICLNINKQRGNVILGDKVKVLWGQGYITDKIGDIAYQISPLSFYQVNPVQTRKMYQVALDYAQLTGKETVWDLYCGIGTISLFFAEHAKQVYGVEIIPEAIADAKRNAQINGITNVEFFVGKAEVVLPEKYEKEGIYADVIVVDPPRKGCDEALLATMIKMRPNRIIYVSCDSATLARDLKYLCENEYTLEKVKGIDNFCHSTHVETVVMLTRERMGYLC